MSTRRGFLVQAGLLGLGATGLWLARDRLELPLLSGLKIEGADSTGWLPFSTRRERIVTVRAQVNGRPVNALIDSGAQYSAIDSDLARELGVTESIGAPVVAYGAGGAGQVGRSVRVDVALGDLTLKSLSAAALTLGPISQGLGGIGTPLILGQDVLRALIADIDFPKRRARLVRPDAFDMPPGAVPAPVQPAGRAIAARVLVEDVELHVLVDTGASAALSLASDTAEALGLMDRPHRTGRSVVLGGVAQGRIVEVESFSFAGQERRDVDVHIFQAQRLPGFPKGLLGYEALKRYRAILDLRSGAMHLIGGRR